MKLYKLVLFSFAIFSLACDNGNIEPDQPESDSPTTSTGGLVQYTPNLSPWDRFMDGPLKDYPAFDDKKGYRYNSHKGYQSNALKHITLMTEQDWKNNHWNGKPFNPEKLTRVQLYKALFPNNHNIMIGLKQLYEKHKPFKNERKPTKAEVDEWNRLVINHFRALCGYSAPKYKVKNSHGLYIMSLWSDEVKYTNKWDNDFYRDGKTVIQDKRATGKAGTRGHYLNRGHYGFGFVAPKNKQKAYYPKGVTPTIVAGNTAEGVSAVREWQPWSTKLSIVLGNMLKTEGFWGGHLGPIWHREKIGISYYKPLIGPNANKKITLQVRLLYHGKLSKPLYTDPDGNGRKY